MSLYHGWVELESGWPAGWFSHENIAIDCKIMAFIYVHVAGVGHIRPILKSEGYLRSSSSTRLQKLSVAVHDQCVSQELPLVHIYRTKDAFWGTNITFCSFGRKIPNSKSEYAQEWIVLPTPVLLLGVWEGCQRSEFFAIGSESITVMMILRVILSIVNI